MYSKVIANTIDTLIEADQPAPIIFEKKMQKQKKENKDLVKMNCNANAKGNFRKEDHARGTRASILTDQSIAWYLCSFPIWNERRPLFSILNNSSKVVPF